MKKNIQMASIGFVLCLIGFWFASNTLARNIELIQSIVVPEKGGDNLQKVDDIYSFFYRTYGLLTASICTFLFVVGQYLKSVPKIQKEHKKTETYLRGLVFSSVVLILIGYCTQIAIIDPIYGRLRAYGQPNYDFSFVDIGWRQVISNPFIYPSIYLLLVTGLFVIFYKGFNRLRHNISANYRRHKKQYNSKEEYSQKINIILYGLLCLLGIGIFGLFWLLQQFFSVFAHGLTLVEIPKVLTLLGAAGLFSQFAKSKATQKDTKGFFGLALVFVPALIALPFVNDSGAMLIFVFAGALIVLSAVLNQYLPLIGFFLYLLIWFVKSSIPLNQLGLPERINDWQLSNVFFTSGIGTGYISGTASSPDIAKAFWAISSGGWFGRGTGLFIADGRNDPYSASAAFAYNDRVGSLLIESYGFVGLVFVLLVYLWMIVSCLRLFHIPQRGYFPGYGVALGVAAIIFGQVAVHIGGNFNFIPFTGIVLPFISHSGMSFFFILSMIVALVALYSPSPKRLLRDEKPSIIEFGQLVGMQNFVLLSFLFLSIAAFQYTIWQGEDLASRIRYDVQSDLSIKKQFNPRLFLLTERMDAKGQIEDGQGNLIRNAKGEYLYKGFDASDYFLHQFEMQRWLELVGFYGEKLDSQYYQRICSLPDGDYIQFAGMSKEQAQEYIGGFFEKRGFSNNPVEEGWEKDCVVTKNVYGAMLKEQLIGEPADPNNAESGCFVNGELHTKNNENTIWFFTEEQELRLNEYMAKQSKQAPVPISDKERRKLLGSKPLTKCVVSQWFTGLETRKGKQKGENCVVSRSFGGGDVVYGRNAIDGTALSSTSATLGIETENIGEGECLAHIKRVGCQHAGETWLTQHDFAEDSTFARVRVNYGSDRSLDFGDTTCAVEIDYLGEIKKTHIRNAEGESQSQFPTLIAHSTKRLRSTIDGINLLDFLRSDLDEQLEQQAKMKEIVSQTKLQIGLHAPLQAKVRELLLQKQEELGAASIQALVFDVNTGMILSQAQASAIRKDKSNFYQKAWEEKKYSLLFQDQGGEYAYGRNHLASKYIPASSFKIYHALAAVDAMKTDYVHTCTNEGYTPADTTDWQKPITCYGKSVHGKLNLKEAIKKSCNQYFASMAIEYTHPKHLEKLCREKNLDFGYDTERGRCRLKEAGSRGAGQNGYGQELVMSLYQIAGMLQAVATNHQPNLEPSAYLYPLEYQPQEAPLLFPVDAAGVQGILEAMREHYIAGKLTKNLSGYRVYGKTGTGDRNISYIDHQSERIGEFIEKRRTTKGKTYWREYIEKPYGVEKASNMAIFIALVEDASYEVDRLDTPRLGIVVRVPRTNHRQKVTGGGVAAPIVQDIISIAAELKLIPQK